MGLIRGDIVLVDFNPAKGGEIGKLRPAIVMSNKENNEILETVIEKNALPYRYHITSRDKLKKDSDACIYEIRALSKIRVREKLSQINDKELKIIQNALCDIINPNYPI